MWHKFKKLIRYPLRQWRTLILILALTIIASAITAIQPWPLKILADYAFSNSDIPAFLVSFLKSLSLSSTPAVLVVIAALASLLLFLINSTITSALSWGWTSAGQRMVYELGEDLFYKLQHKSLLFYNRRSMGDILSRLTDDTYSIYTVTSDLLITPGQNVLTLISISVIAWMLEPQLTMLSLAVAPVLAGSAVFFGRRLKKRSRQDREAKSRLMSFVHQTLSAIPVVQAFSKEASNTLKFQRLASDAISLSKQRSLLSNTFGLVNNIFTTIGVALVLYVGGRRVLTGALSVGSLLVFIAYIRSMEKAFQGLLTSYGKLKAEEAGIDRVLELFEVEDGVKETPDAKPLSSLPSGKEGHIQFDNVFFGYEPGRPVLKSIDLDVKPNEKVAIVGSTGAGKSTLALLIPRFFDPWDGRILLDGLDISELKLPDLRAHVALVFQEPFLLPLTISENIAYGRPDVSPEEVEAAAIASRAAEFIQQLPNGYDTVIGERGETLSGGEKQRLSIARALLKDAPVLILDEPTSALDAHTEAQLLEAFERLMEGKTTFFIAHRLSTIRKVDRIIVLEEGRIVETGSHDELLANDGRYHQLYSLQMSRSFQEGS